MHHVWYYTLKCNASELINEVNRYDRLTEHFKVEVPPAQINEWKETIEELENESFDDE